jgi:NADPH-dependent 2,4-dienoyl-CoA reductase/sulfur reductase-like enzyme
MKRGRSQLSSSPEMSPGVEGEGFDARTSNGILKEQIEDVVVSGAGPAGLMLA